MVQATNWLADGRMLRLMRHALTALSNSEARNKAQEYTILYSLMWTQINKCEFPCCMPY